MAKEVIRKQLDNLGRRIIDDARKYAAPNKNTGKLDRSLNYTVDMSNIATFTINLNEAYYGKYLNNKTEFMDKAIRKNLDRGINNIVDSIVDDILGGNNNNNNNI